MCGRPVSQKRRNEVVGRPTRARAPLSAVNGICQGGGLLANARDLLLTGRTLDAHEAQRMGLVARVVAHDRLRDEAIGAAESILRTAPEARLPVKRILNERYGHVDRMTMDGSIFRGSEVREGMRAFAEKRAPGWIPEALRTGKRL